MSELIQPANSKHNQLAIKLAKEIVQDGKRFYEVAAKYAEKTQVMKDTIDLLLFNARAEAIAFGRKHAEAHNRATYPLGKDDLKVVKVKYKELCGKYGVNPEAPAHDRYELVEFDAKFKNGQPGDVKHQIRDTHTGALVVYKGARSDRSELRNGGTVWQNPTAAFTYCTRLNAEAKAARKKAMRDED